MDRGYIKLFRKLKGSSIWMLEPTTFKAAIYLLLEANYEPKTEFIHNVGRNVEIKRGELITSYDSIASACGHRGKHNKIRPLTIRQARTTVDKLKSINFVTKVATERCLHLRIENFDAYQSWPVNATEETTDKMSDPRQTPDREQELKNTLPSKSGEERPPEWAIEIAEEFKVQLEGNGNLPTRLAKDHIKRWAWVLEKCHRIDKRSIDEIRAVALYPQRDPRGFWQKNFRSLRKLRDRSRSDPDLTYYDNLLSGCREYGLLEGDEWKEMPIGSGR